MYYVVPEEFLFCWREARVKPQPRTLGTCVRDLRHAHGFAIVSTDGRIYLRRKDRWGDRHWMLAIRGW